MKAKGGREREKAGTCTGRHSRILALDQPLAFIAFPACPAYAVAAARCSYSSNSRAPIRTPSAIPMTPTAASVIRWPR